MDNSGVSPLLSGPGSCQLTTRANPHHYCPKHTFRKRPAFLALVFIFLSGSKEICWPSLHVGAAPPEMQFNKKQNFLHGGDVGSASPKKHRKIDAIKDVLVWPRDSQDLAGGARA